MEALQAHYNQIHNRHLRTLFSEDPSRGERLTVEAAGLYFDYSKHRVTDETMRLLLALTEDVGLHARIDAMFRGDKINVTEKRAVLHVALRAPRGASILVDGKNVVPEVHEVLDRMAEFSTRVRDGSWTGHTGKRIRNVINIGIGGSDLGPVMAYEALRYYSDRGLTMRFVSNVDGTDFAEATRDLNPAETLFIVSSKTFTTLETMTNARTARDWSLAVLGDKTAVAKHFVAVSTNAAEVTKFGIDTKNMFGFWDWVGGRYSMDSAIGLSTMIAVGADNFRAMLSGFHAIDEHFRTAPFAQNLPVLMGPARRLVQRLLWCANRRRAPLRAIPEAISRLSATAHDGIERQARDPRRRVNRLSDRADLLGRTRHQRPAFVYQLIHQGTKIIPCDFIGFCRPLNRLGRHHDLLLSNIFAQAEALAFGKTPEQVKAEGTPDWLVPHRVFEGNRPSTVILADELTPETLGKLVALHEHSVFTQGTIWNIDSFDQWGVELGKVLAQKIIPELESETEPPLAHDSSTNALIRRYRNRRGA